MALKGDSWSGAGSPVNYHSVIGEFLCMVAGCALGTYVWQCMFFKKSTWFKVNKVPLYEEKNRTFLG